MGARTLETQNLSLLEALDRLLNKGVVVTGDAFISVADVDLIYLSIKLFVSSVETAQKYLPKEGKGNECGK